MDNPSPLIIASSNSKRQRETKLKKDIEHARNTLSLPDYEMALTQKTVSKGISTMVQLDKTNSHSEPITAEEVFEIIRNIMDPEHPLSLEQLSVVSLEGISVDNDHDIVSVEFCPTIPHCSQATMIGLMLRVKLSRCLPSCFKIDIRVKPGTHHTEDAINKQLNDKERVAAALENTTVLNVINQGIADRDEPFLSPFLDM